MSTSKANAERLLHPPTSTASFSRGRLRVLAVVLIRRICVITPVHCEQFDTTCRRRYEERAVRILLFLTFFRPYKSRDNSRELFNLWSLSLLVRFTTLTQI